MANSYKTPGVYVEEISLLPPSIAEVETAIPAFIGYTEKATKLVTDDLRNVPTRITSMLDYERYFGYAEPETGIVVEIRDTTNGAGTLLSRTITAKEPTAPSEYLMYYSLRMFFDNGGGPCYIISVGSYSNSVSKTDLGNAGGLMYLEKEDEPTLIVFPDATDISTAANYYALIQEALEQCGKLQDRFAIIDTYSDADSAVATLRSNLASTYQKYGAAYYPYLKTTQNYYYKDADITLDHEADGVAGTLDTLKLTTLISGANQNNELYNQIKSELTKLTVALPPSSAVAGVYAKTDKDRGVWKAPANVPLNAVVGPTKKITNTDQDTMNVDPTAGKSVNAIRAFTGKGTIVWGARTLSGNDNEWRYISVRRFFNFAEESIKKGSSWVVFEPNDANTWVRVKGMIENFLIKQWRAGALAGAKPEHAFFVKVGLGETMTALDVLEGRMNVEIGMAVVRPAEFIILKFSHKMQQS
jgi:phage tail sheath protein FI